jgi:hypothetical protein
MTEERIAEWQRAGYGKGTGASYKPWIEVGDFSSMGDSTRSYGLKTGRTMHCHSQIESNLLCLLEFAPTVTDIREQYPLDSEGTLTIAAELGIKHPVYPGTKIPLIMTTDFLVTVQAGEKLALKAIACKSANDLENPRTLAKLQIEHAYFERSGVPHHLVIDADLPLAKIRNLKWMRDAKLSARDEGHMEELSERFLATFTRYAKPGLLAEFCAYFDVQFALQRGVGLRIARKLLWERRLVTDLGQPDLPATPLAMFSVPDSMPLSSGSRTRLA